MISAFIKGLMLSFSLILPIGSQNVFIFNQGMVQDKYRYVLPAVLMTILCDSILIFLAVIGVDLFSHFIWFKPFILGLGILFLTYIGLRVWQSASQMEDGNPPHQMTVLKQIIFAISVSLLNPHAVLDLFVIIGAASNEYATDEKQAFLFGCFLIEFLWFFTLSLGGFHLKKIKYIQSISFFVNKISAIIMWIVALVLTNQLFNTFNLGVL